MQHFRAYQAAAANTLPFSHRRYLTPHLVHAYVQGTNKQMQRWAIVDGRRRTASAASECLTPRPYPHLKFPASDY
eukprot:365443-Chlamydomonas_euryale.AAC.30